MERIQLGDAVVEYAVEGTGEPVLLIHPGVTADGLGGPLLQQRELASSYRLITYHRRGYGGSTIGVRSLSIAEQARDAGELLRHLGVSTAHVVGHSSGGVIALQLARDKSELVQSLALLEAALLNFPSGKVVFGQILLPALERYRSGDQQGALDLFLSGVFGPDWKVAIEAAVPGAVEQAIAAADVFFGAEMPAIQNWTFGSEDAAKITQPILAVVGAESPGFRFDGRQQLHAWFAQVEDLDLDGANHLLQMRNPEGMAHSLTAFFKRHPIETPA